MKSFKLYSIILFTLLAVTAAALNTNQDKHSRKVVFTRTHINDIPQGQVITDYSGENNLKNTESIHIEHSTESMVVGSCLNILARSCSFQCCLCAAIYDSYGYGKPYGVTGICTKCGMELANCDQSEW